MGGVIPLAVPRTGLQPVSVLILLQWGLEVLGVKHLVAYGDPGGA